MLVIKEKNFFLINIVFKAIIIVISVAPVITIIYILLGILFGISFGLKTVVMQYFFDRVTESLVGNVAPYRLVLVTFMLGGVTILTEILNVTYNYSFNICEAKVSGRLNKQIYEKVSKLEPVMFQDAGILDRINKSQKGSEGILGIFVVITMVFTFYLPYFVFMGMYLFKLDRILVVSLVLIFIPILFTQFMKVKLYSSLEDSIAPIRRECNYYKKCICSIEYFKETRILGAVNYFKDLFNEAMDILNQLSWRTETKSCFIELIMKVVTLIGYIGVLLILCRSLLIGKITVGAFAAVFNSIGIMITLMDEMICVQFGKFTREFGTAKNFLEFFKLPEHKGSNLKVSVNSGIEIKGVSFKYPSSSHNSLDNINLTIKPKETIAIVGENGAGKSTLVKVIIGLYKPTVGLVKYGNDDITKVSLQSLSNIISAVFQKFRQYKMNVWDNIIISDISNSSKDRVIEAVKKSELDFKKNTFPEGYNTMLSREFGGVDISGGQWQKIAIARGFYKHHDLIVLDEPTASIDPIEETKLYKKFAELSYDKIAIIVTHRLGAAKIADRIVVMNKGKIEEIGRHEELMTRNGKYAEMFLAQSKWYQRNE